MWAPLSNFRVLHWGAKFHKTMNKRKDKPDQQTLEMWATMRCHITHNNFKAFVFWSTFLEKTYFFLMSISGSSVLSTCSSSSINRFILTGSRVVVQYPLYGTYKNNEECKWLLWVSFSFDSCYLWCSLLI